MNKSKYLKKLYRKLYFFGRDERKSIVDYYSEIIDDAIESGKTEELAVSELESPEIIARKYRKQRKTEWENAGKKIPTWFWVVLLVGSPVWLALFVSVLAVVIAVVAAVFAVIVGFTVGGIVFVISGIVNMFLDFSLGLAKLGTGIFVFALGSLIAIGSHILLKKIIKRIKSYKELNK